MDQNNAIKVNICFFKTLLNSFVLTVKNVFSVACHDVPKTLFTFLGNRWHSFSKSNLTFEKNLNLFYTRQTIFCFNALAHYFSLISKKDTDKSIISKYVSRYFIC